MQILGRMGWILDREPGGPWKRYMEDSSSHWVEWREIDRAHSCRCRRFLFLFWQPFKALVQKDANSISLLADLVWLAGSKLTSELVFDFEFSRDFERSFPKSTKQYYLNQNVEKCTFIDELKIQRDARKLSLPNHCLIAVRRVCFKRKFESCYVFGFGILIAVLIDDRTRVPKDIAEDQDLGGCQ